MTDDERSKQPTDGYEIMARVHLDERLIRQGAGRQKKRDCYDYAMLVIQAALASIGIVAIFIAAYQVREARRAIDATREAVAAASRSADIAEAQFLAENRPWVRADFGIAEPLHFREDGVGLMKLRAAIRNDGQSVALEVMVKSKLLSGMVKEIPAAQEQWCEPMRGRSGDLLVGDMLFPGEEPMVMDDGLSIDREEVEAALAVTKVTGKIPLFVIVCLDYRSTFSKRSNQTRYAFQLGEPLPVGMMGWFEPKGTLDKLRLHRVMTGFYAD